MSEVSPPFKAWRETAPLFVSVQEADVQEADVQGDIYHVRICGRLSLATQQPDICELLRAPHSASQARHLPGFPRGTLSG